MRAERAALDSGKSREDAIDAVRDYFYRGPIAREIAEFVKSDGGLLRYEDFAAFRLEVERPLVTEFHGYEIYKPDFWTQGAVLLQALNILEGYDLEALGWNTPAYIHHLVEALKLAFADRDAWYADPKFVSVPAALLSKEYAGARRALINPKRSSTEFRPGRFGRRQPMHPSRHARRRPLPDLLASKDTTSINIATADGTLFSASPSGAWMPAVVAGSTGIPLTQRGHSFLTVRGHPNVVEPGKRPRITLTPTLVTRRGEPFMALSTPAATSKSRPCSKCCWQRWSSISTRRRRSKPRASKASTWYRASTTMPWNRTCCCLTSGCRRSSSKIWPRSGIKSSCGALATAARHRRQ